MMLDSAIPALYEGQPVAIVGVFGGAYLRILMVRANGELVYTTTPEKVTVNVASAGNNIAWALEAEASLPVAIEEPKPTYDHELEK
jgi:hypothetical protein